MERVEAVRAVAARIALRRRLVVAVLTAIAVVSGLDALRPSLPPTVAIWVAAHDLTGGRPLAAGDLRVEQLAMRDLPAGVLRSTATVAGRLLAAPMRRGEPFTDVRLLSPALLSATGDPGNVAVPVRVADGPAALALVHAGDLVDVIATPDADSGVPLTGSAVVHDVRVLATPTNDGAAADGSDNSAGLLIIAATPHQASVLAQAAVGARLSIAVRRAP